MGNMGTPLALKRKFGTPDELDKAIAEYFRQCKEHRKPSTIERLAEFLDCSDRTLMRYKEYYDKFERVDDNEESAPDDFVHDEEKVNFCHPIKKAYQRIKAEDIERLKERGNSGDIFIAKNHGYTDKQELHHTGGTTNSVNVNYDLGKLTVDELSSIKAILTKAGAENETAEP